MPTLLNKLRLTNNFNNNFTQEESAHLYKQVQTLQKLLAKAAAEKEILETEIQGLRSHLARKYAHVARLKSRVEQYERADTVIDFSRSNTPILHSHASTISLMSDSQRPAQDQLIFWSDAWELDSQSAEMTAEAGQATMSTSNQQVATITHFSDGDSGFTTKVEGGDDATMRPGYSSNAEISSFMMRPVKIVDTDWLVGQSAYANFNPWQLYFENVRVNEKLKNFNLLRCNLHLKFLINGTQFHYGRALASYNPLPGLDGVTVNRQFIFQDLVGASQKPHIFLNPTTGEGGEMCLPYFWFKNYMSITDADYRELGEIFINSFQQLQHANGGTTPVRISVFAWAENVVLTMPTSLTPPAPAAQLLSQAAVMDGSLKTQGSKSSSNTGSDEYGMGIISKPASAVAKATGMLENVPVIGPYMRASSMVSAAIAGAARLFGYSRPAIVSDITLYKPFPQGNLANVDASEAASKLTFDSKQELTIDPRTVGLGPTDQMTIKSIVTRESFLTEFSWEPQDNPEDLLWNTYVTPVLLAQLGSEFHMTPMCHYSTLWEYWHGTIKFRFQVVASAFHKGRMLIRYDPALTVTPIEYNTGFSRVIDIAEEPDFEIEVAWGQAIPFLQCSAPTQQFFDEDARLARDFSGEMNGILELSVINELVSPANTTPISINVFVSMGDDFKFGGPNPTQMNNFSYFPFVSPALEGQLGALEEAPAELESQSAEIDTAIMNVAFTENVPVSPTAIEPISDVGPPSDETMNVFFGESITSLRELFKRYIFTNHFYQPTLTVNTVNLVSTSFTSMPGTPGYDPSGQQTVAGNPATACAASPISYFKPCFAAWRGSLRKKIMLDGITTNPNVVIYRDVDNAIGSRIGNTTRPLSDTAAASRFILNRTGQNTYRGTMVCPTTQNKIAEIDVPFYQNQRFLSSRFIRADQSFSTQVSVREPITVGAVASVLTPVTPDGRSYMEWCAAGEDFSLFFYTGVPIMYRYSILSGA